MLLASASSLGICTIVLPMGLAHGQSTLPTLRGTYDSDAYRLGSGVNSTDGSQTTDQSPIRAPVQRTIQTDGAAAQNDVQFRTRSALPALPALGDRARERQAERDQNQGRASTATLPVGASGLSRDGVATPSPANARPLPLTEPDLLAAQPVQPEPQVLDETSITGSLSNPSTSARANVPAVREQSGANTLDEEPFAPTGSRWGSFLAFFRLEQFFGYTDNFSQSAEGKASSFSETSGSAVLRSDWSRHELQITANGTYRAPFEGDEVDIPTADINAALRLDMVDGWSVTPEIFAGYSRENFSSRELSSDVSDTPELSTYGVALGVERTDRKLQIAVRGSASQSTYTDARLKDGTSIDQSDRDVAEYEIIARAGYEISPALTPFVEGRYAVDQFDRKRDRNGIKRDSETYEVRAGVEVDLGEKLQGEFAVGFLTQEFDDDDLERLESLTLNGDLVWSPVRDTTVTFNLGTQTQASTQAGNSGSVIYRAGVDYQRQVNDRMAVNLNGAVQLDDDQGSGDQDVLFEVGAGIEYWMNRHWGVAAEIDYENFDAADGNRSYDATTGKVGIILQN